MSLLRLSLVLPGRGLFGVFTGNLCLRRCLWCYLWRLGNRHSLLLNLLRYLLRDLLLGRLLLQWCRRLLLLRWNRMLLLLILLLDRLLLLLCW